MPATISRLAAPLRPPDGGGGHPEWNLAHRTYANEYGHRSLPVADNSPPVFETADKDPKIRRPKVFENVFATRTL